ncbi:MAG: polysaccharide export protein EpsE [Pseudomonadota bacterium]
MTIFRTLSGFITFLSTFLIMTLSINSQAQANSEEYVLSSGDIIRVTVFQNPDLTTETRVSEAGSITFPLVGSVRVGSLGLQAAEREIASRLRSGGFVVEPQVSILLMQIRGNQIAVLGSVNRPGRYPLETTDLRISDILAIAGGISPEGSDSVVLIGLREGKMIRRPIDTNDLFIRGSEPDLPLASGDIVYVERAPVFYIYGEVQRPGSFRLNRNMSIMQGLALAGGLNQRGTLRGLQLHRRNTKGQLKIIEPTLKDEIRQDDVVYIKESIF